MRLALIKNDFGDPCISARLSRNDPQVSWISLALREMNDHTGVVDSEIDILRGMFDGFSKCFVPDGSRVYAVLNYYFANEYKATIDELRRSGRQFITEKGAAARHGLLRRLQYWKLGSRTIYVGDAKREDLSRWYRESESWTITGFKFLISPIALPDWMDDLARVSIGTIDKDFLRKAGRVLFNHFDHAIKAISLDEPTAPLEAMARELSRKFNLPLQIADKRN